MLILKQLWTTFFFLYFFYKHALAGYHNSCCCLFIFLFLKKYHIAFVLITLCFGWENGYLRLFDIVYMLSIPIRTNPIILILGFFLLEFDDLTNLGFDVSC